MDCETLRFGPADTVASLTLDRKDNPANAPNGRISDVMHNQDGSAGIEDYLAEQMPKFKGN